MATNRYIIRFQKKKGAGIGNDWYSYIGLNVNERYNLYILLSFIKRYRKKSITLTRLILETFASHEEECTSTKCYANKCTLRRIVLILIGARLMRIVQLGRARVLHFTGKTRKLVKELIPEEEENEKEKYEEEESEEDNDEED